MSKKAVLFSIFFSLLSQTIFNNAVWSDLLAPFSPFAIGSTHSEPLPLREGMRYKAALVVTKKESQNQVIASWLQRGGIPFVKTATNRFSAIWELERILRGLYQEKYEGDEILVVMDEYVDSLQKVDISKIEDKKSLIKTIKEISPETDVFVFAGTPLGRKASFEVEMNAKGLRVKDNLEQLMKLKLLDGYAFSDIVIMPLVDEEKKIIKLMGEKNFRKIIKSLALRETSPFLQEMAASLSYLRTESSL